MKKSSVKLPRLKTKEELLKVSVSHNEWKTKARVHFREASVVTEAGALGL